jgi:hypothetical protein
MVDGHSRGHATEVLLPRATINPPCAHEFIVVMDGRRLRQFGYGFYFEPEQRRKAPGAAMPWLFTAFSLHSEKIFQGWWLLCGSQQSWLACAQHPQPLSTWFFSNSALHLIGICLGTMVRKRGKPRRGSAWDAHKAQRRREEELERALALASSILRKKARVERRAVLNTIVEQGAGCSRTEKETEPADLFSGCVVEEDLSIGDLPCDEKPSAMETLSRQGTKCIPTKDDDLPGCVVEEIPWTGDLQATGAEKMVKAETVVVQRKLAVGIGEAVELKTAPPSGLGGGTHGPLLSDEHLALVFELRSHIADLEHRALIMGQRIDLLLDAFSGAPAQRKCPLCTQTFAIPAGTGGSDTSPGA